MGLPLPLGEAPVDVEASHLTGSLEDGASGREVQIQARDHSTGAFASGDLDPRRPLPMGDHRDLAGGECQCPDLEMEAGLLAIDADETEGPGLREELRPGGQIRLEDQPPLLHPNPHLAEPDDEVFLDLPGDVYKRQLRERWDDLLSNVKVSTPDEHTDRMVNVWNAYQCMVTFNLSRSASSYESGIGRGMGFRDSNQDLLCLLYTSRCV